MRFTIDRPNLPPWEIEPLEVFIETWDHVLSTALMYSVQQNKRGFRQTGQLYKQGKAQVRRLAAEPLTLEKVVELVASWCGAGPKDNHEALIAEWAADPGTWGVVAAHRFAESVCRSFSLRPQMALPLATVSAPAQTAEG
jgi:hypothetical protein